jgi:hypothetical protein
MDKQLDVFSNRIWDLNAASRLMEEQTLPNTPAAAAAAAAAEANKRCAEEKIVDDLFNFLLFNAIPNSN